MIFKRNQSFTLKRIREKCSCISFGIGTLLIDLSWEMLQNNSELLGYSDSCKPLLEATPERNNTFNDNKFTKKYEHDTRHTLSDFQLISQFWKVIVVINTSLNTFNC